MVEKKYQALPHNVASRCYRILWQSLFLILYLMQQKKINNDELMMNKSNELDRCSVLFIYFIEQHFTFFMNKEKKMVKTIYK